MQCKVVQELFVKILPVSFSILLLLVSITLLPENVAAEKNYLPHGRIVTSMGVIEFDLYPDRAPETVENFRRYVKQGFYNNTIFHRVIPKFMIQGGGLTADMKAKNTGKPIQSEAGNGLRNIIGALAMARTGDPHSANAQFFINTKDNFFLDYQSKTSRGWGYTVFGFVTSGMDVVRKIEAVKTATKQGFQNVPVQPVTIKSITID